MQTTSAMERLRSVPADGFVSAGAPCRQVVEVTAPSTTRVPKKSWAKMPWVIASGRLSSVTRRPPITPCTITIASAAQPSRRTQRTVIDALQEERQDQGGQTDQRPQQAVGVLVVDPAGHLREGIEEHVVAERGGPVRHRQARLGGSDQPADAEQQQRGGDGDDHEAAGPGAHHRFDPPARTEHRADSGKRGRDQHRPGNPPESGRNHPARLGSTEEAAQDQQVEQTADQPGCRAGAEPAPADAPQPVSACDQTAQHQHQQQRAGQQDAGQPAEVAHRPHRDGGAETEGENGGAWRVVPDGGSLDRTHVLHPHGGAEIVASSAEPDDNARLASRESPPGHESPASW